MTVDMGWSACLWNCRQVVVAHSNADDDNHEIQPDDSPGKNSGFAVDTLRSTTWTNGAHVWSTEVRLTAACYTHRFTHCFGLLLLLRQDRSD